jgi:hypothetical protein
MICFSCYHFATQLGSTHENRGDTRLDRPKDQPHAIAHVLQPTLWGENQKREPVSITGDAQRMVPHAPGPSPGAPKGNKVFGSTRSTMRPACPVLALPRRAEPAEWPLCAKSDPPREVTFWPLGPHRDHSSRRSRNSSIFLSGPSHPSNVDDPIAVALQRSRPGFPKSSRQECRGYGIRCGNWTWTILDLFRSCEQGSLRLPGRSPSGTVRHRRRFPH